MPTHFFLAFRDWSTNIWVSFLVLWTKYRDHSSVLIKHYSFHFIVFIHGRIILHGISVNSSLQLLFVFAGLWLFLGLWTSMIRLIHESTSCLVLAFVGKKMKILNETVTFDTYKLHPMKQCFWLFINRTWKNFYFIFLHIEKTPLIFWKGSMIRL